MLQPRKMQFDKAGEKIAEALRARHFEAYYVKTGEEATKKVLSLIPKDNSVSWGGSMTMDQLNIRELLKENGYTVIDRDTATSPEERVEIMRRGLTADTFIMSCNAITQSGILFNIDGAGNRVGALCYGPKNVVVIAGMNKIVKDEKEAYTRVRNYVAPAVVQRFPTLETPCNKFGLCYDCQSTDCICAQMVMTRTCRPAGRIKVILVGEELGL